MARKSKKSKTVCLINELIRDSSRTDRELAKIVGVSQPTISRTKKSLLEDGTLQDFVALPDFNKIGYELMAITFVKIKAALAPLDVREKNFETVKAWMDKQNNVIFCSSCRGLNCESFFISLHKNYMEFDSFIKKHDVELGRELLVDINSALVNLADEQTIKPFNFKYLAEHNL